MSNLSPAPAVTVELPPLVSILVPVWQSPEPLGPLYQEYAAPIRERNWKFEFIFIAEPGFAGEIESLLKLAKEGEPIRVFQVAQRLDESNLYQAGLTYARGSVLVTLPGYRRIEAGHLPGLIDRVLQGADLVVARRWPRRDSRINRIQNRLLHLLIKSTAGGNFRDVACGVRAMRPEVLLNTPVYGDSFRFFSLLAKQAGYVVEEVDAPQHLADRRMRLYRPSLYSRRLLDLLGIYVILRFTSRPLRFFGAVGGGLVAVGTVILLISIFHGIADITSAARVGLLAGLFLLVLGIQTLAIGLIGEIIVFLQAPVQTRYRIVERIN
jgi:hypothetical protein